MLSIPLLLLPLACSSPSPIAAPAGISVIEGSPEAGVVTAPEAHLRRPLGQDRTLVDWREVSSYFRLLAEESPRVRADGRTWPAGSLVIRRDQPYGTYVKDLFDVQRYQGDLPPYDVAGWTLPFLLGVDRVEATELPEGELVPAADVAGAVAAFRGDPRLEGHCGDPLMSVHDSSTWSRIYVGLAEGRSYYLEHEEEDSGLVFDGKGWGDESVSSLPRTGIYAPWRGSSDEGWMRWVLDTQEVPYVRVRNEMLRAGRLADFLDVLILPGISSRRLDRGREPGTVDAEYTRGLDAEGAVAIEEFVRGGGTLLATGASSDWAIELFELPLVDVTREAGAEGFSCPGSVLRTIPESGRYTMGLPASLPVFFARSRAWRELDAKELEREVGASPPRFQTLLRYAPTRVLMSGGIEEPSRIAGRAAWVEARHGEGTVHLFGFQPHFRGWTQVDFSLIHRAVLLSGSQR